MFGFILESVNLQLLLLDDANLQKKLANVLPLVALKLNDLSVLRVFNHSPITGEFLQHRESDAEVLLLTEQMEPCMT